jgi:hypothetical protein
MQVLQDGVIQAFPRHLVPAVSEIVRDRFQSVVHGVSFDPWDNVMVGTCDGLIFGGAVELAGMFPEPDSILDRMLLVDEFEEDPWIGLGLFPVQRVSWEAKRRPGRSWKWSRANRWER